MNCLKISFCRKQGMNNSASSGSCKRKRDDEDESNGENKPVNDKQSNTCVQSQSNKCSVREGHSWWTCMMLDNMPMSMTKPQRVDQNSSQK